MPDTTPAPATGAGQQTDPADGAPGPVQREYRRPQRAAKFVVTKEHRRFIEFADACRRGRYIGLCYGPPGVGKTLPAHQYTHWSAAERWMEAGASWPWSELAGRQGSMPKLRDLLYTPSMTATPSRIDKDLGGRSNKLCWLANTTDADSGVTTTCHNKQSASCDHVELLLVDEAERLNARGLEQLRDRYDRSNFGLVLIGMPGIERRLARYPQLYSRVGFVHRYQPLSTDELAFVLTRRWPKLGLHDSDDFTTAEAIAAIARYTNGNFRLLDRLLAQAQRILQINQLSNITADVVDLAREALIVGPQ